MHGSTVAAVESGALTTAVSSFERGHHYHHYPTTVWPKTKRDPVFPTTSPSHQEACIGLLSSSTRGQTE